MTAGREPTAPFRWDLVTPDQLGRLLDGVPEPDLWYLDDLTRCAAAVLGRCADGDLYFVGRSPDSLFDLLSGALSGTSWRDRCTRLPLSLWTDPDALTPAQVAQFRTNLADAGITPDRLTHGRRPVTFVDLVYAGQTYRNLFLLLRRWIADQGAPWAVARRKLRFIGITSRGKTSPNTWRWYQDASWAVELPRRALIGVSLDRYVWSYLGDFQPKTTRSFPVTRWLDHGAGSPARAEKSLSALAEAVALVAHGRTRTCRRALVSGLVAEPAMREPWLRSLVTELRR